MRSRWLYYLNSLPTLITGVANWPEMVACFLHFPIKKPLLIKLRDGSQYYIYTPMDIWVIKETCLDRQYQTASLEIQNGWTVIDIGAAAGDFAVSVAKDCPNCRILAFEPFPQSFETLQKNLLINHVKNVIPLPLAISGHGHKTTLAVSNEAVQHSTAASASQQKSLEVETITLEQVFKSQNIDHCNYLKMDCEGAEFDILFNAGSTLLNIQHICMEYHDGVTPHHHLELVKFLTDQGFEVHLIPNPVHNHIGLLYAKNLK